MTKLLRQKASGEIFVWTESMAARDDMEPYERVAPQPIPKPEPVLAEEPQSAEEPQPSVSPEMVENLFRKRRTKKAPA